PSGLFEAAAGPGIGAASDLMNHYARARTGDAEAAGWLNVALRNTPFVNLAYVRPAMDYLVLNALRDAISPGFLERQRTSRASNFGQSLLYPQTIESIQ